MIHLPKELTGHLLHAQNCGGYMQISLNIISALLGPWVDMRMQLCIASKISEQLILCNREEKKSSG